MRFNPRARNIDAVQLTADITYGEDDSYRGSSLRYMARKGDWLVVDSDGTQEFVTNSSFIYLYQQAL